MKKLPLQFLRFLAGAVAVLLMAAVPGARAHSIEQANTFGQIIALPGHINDLAVDEVRRLVYAGNFSAGRVEVISMTTNQRITSFPTSPQPSAMSGMAMSLDARFLVAINVPVTSGVSQLSSITVINLNDSTDRRHFSLPDTPLAVTFINGGDALIVTTSRLLLFDPEDGSTRVLIDLENPPPDVVLPTPLPAFPREHVTASVATSADGKWVYGLSDAFLFVYQVFQPTGLLSFRLTDGLVNLPVFNDVSVSGDGQYAMMAQLLVNRRLRIVADTPEAVDNALGLVGSQAIDSEIDTVYVSFDTAPEFETGDDEHPLSGVLQMMDLDNLLVRKRIRITERLTGPLALDSAGETMYGVSESGLLYMPLNRLSEEPQLEFHPDDRVIFEQFDSCRRLPAVHTLRVESAGGSPAQFQLSVDDQRSSGRPAVLFEPDVGFTPADVKVTIDPWALGPVQGTSTFPVNILTNAVNIPLGGIVHANVVGVDQKGTLYPVPGSFVDVIADPYRDRFYVLDQADFRVLVFDSDFRLTGSFRTGNTPTAMAMTQDGTSLLVANSQSETITWIDLNVFINRGQIFFPWRILGSGHYPRSIATDSTNIMMSAQSAAGGVLAFLDMRSRIISVPDTLGIFDNNVDAGAGLAGTPDGRGILIAEPGGGVSFFEAQTSRIILSRNDLPGLSGAVGAGPDYFIVDNHVLNSALVEIGMFEDSATNQESSGFTLNADGIGVRSVRPTSQVDTGALQELDPRDPRRLVNPVRMVEPPPPASPFFP